MVLYIRSYLRRTYCFNIWSISVSSFLYSLFTHVVLNVRRSAKATTVVLQGALPSRGELCLSHLYHCATIMGTCCSHTVSQTRRQTQRRPKAETSSMELQYKTHCSMDRLLKRSNITLLLHSTVGHTSWVLVWPHHRLVQGASWTKPLPWYLWGTRCVAYPNVTCSSVWGKPILCQQVYIPCTYVLNA